MYVRVLTATALASVAGQAHGQQLDAALRSTLAGDPQIAGAAASVQAARAAVDVSRAARLPVIGVEARAGLQMTDRFFGPRQGRTLGVAASFDLPLYTGGEVQGRIGSSRAALAAEEAQRDVLVNDRLAAAASRYAGLYRDRTIETARRMQVTDVDAILTATRERARLRELTDADVQQSVARLALSKARLAEARAALTQSDESLREVTGSYFTAVDDPAPPPLPATLSAGLPQDVAAFPAVRLAAARVEMARAEVRIARAARAPRLYLTSGLQGANDLATGISSVAQRSGTAMQIAFTLRMPLYQGGAPAARVRQAEQVLANRLEDRRDAENQVVADIRSQFAQVRAAETAIVALAAAAEAGQAALKGVRVQALLGDRTNLDILNAQEEVTQARVQLAQVRQRRIALAYSILGLMGRLQPAAIDREARPATRPPTPPVAKVDSSGLWAWQGSATWSLTPGRKVERVG